MILLVLIGVLLVGGALAWIVGKRAANAARVIALLALAIDLALTLYLAQTGPLHLAVGERGWLLVASWSWLPTLGVRLQVGVDGLSVILALLTLVLGLVAVLASWREIKEHVGFFHFNTLWVLAGILGVFFALDLFLFYFFWELMLVPMYFLIGIFGHERRIFAAIKFFLFTQAGGLLMLIAIITLAWLQAGTSGKLSFSYFDLLNVHLGSGTEMLLMLGFFFAFAVKLPVFPLHTWLPDAHTEAPTGGSVILAGLLLKTGAYGLLRFALPLFPSAAASFAPVAMVLGTVGVLYGALLAFAQTDLKRLVAYTSVSHMGFVLLGLYAGSAMARSGAILEMVSHGLSTGGLFVVAGIVGERAYTRDLRHLGGLWTTMPRLGVVALILGLASLGLPGLANFVAEFLVLAGAFVKNPGMSAIATLGLVLATIYTLRLIQRAFWGPLPQTPQLQGLTDLSVRELFTFAVIVALLLLFGFYPHPVLDTVRTTPPEVAINTGGTP